MYICIRISNTDTAPRISGTWRCRGRFPACLEERGFFTGCRDLAVGRFRIWGAGFRGLEFRVWVYGVGGLSLGCEVFYFGIWVRV